MKRIVPGVAVLIGWMALTGCAPPGDPMIHKIVSDISEENIRQSVEKLASFGTRHTLSDVTSAARGIGAARYWIKAEFDRYAADSGGRLVVETQSFIAPPDGKRVNRDVEIVNIVATLPGKDSDSRDRIYLVSGHYDSICSDVMDSASDAPGANDDASGVAAVLELARVMSKHEFDATLVFAAVAGEEQRLIGSDYMAKEFRKRDVNIAGMFTNDIIGNTVGGNGVLDRTHVRVFSEGVPITESTEEQKKERMDTGNENDSPARQLARYIDTIAGEYVPGLDVVMIYRRDRFLRGGDHKSFSEQGYPAVRFTEMNEDYRRQHQNVRVEGGVQYGDLPQFVDYGYVAQVARVNAAALVSLALAPAPPANLRVLTEKLENTTRLEWDVGKEHDLEGYEVVWRETTAPQWQHTMDVGPSTGCTHPLSKDNYIFGVRSVDKTGLRSVVAYPRPWKPE
ncbi:MAG TPA: M20/M25/M40 family metallo-hydrolase [Phycisphaerae bacterium]|nr:M20/M25/M40 family metallo-hydrolase [Phycisphaerae bacterium]